MKSPISLNPYAQLLKEQGKYTINIEGIDWYEYQGFMMPAYLPHCVPKITPQITRKVLRETACPFARWDTKFSQIENGPWWYILKKGNWNIADVPGKKKRWMIKQGIKNFQIRLLTFDEILDYGPHVAQRAAQRYAGAARIETREILERRISATENFPGLLEYMGCFCADKLISWSENYIQQNAVWMETIRHDPEYLRKYSSYGLLNGILEYYLNERKMLYVLDGCRSIHHKTGFQDHLTKVFGFTKEYALLNVMYSKKFNILVNAAYPVRKIVFKFRDKFSNSFMDNVGAVLKQEQIRRECQKLA